MTVWIRAAKLSDIEQVVKNTPLDTKAAIDISKTYFKGSIFTWAGGVDSGIACLYGLISPTVLNDTAYLWLITNDLVDQHQFSFVRHSQIEVKKMLEVFPLIKGHVLETEKRSKRWLKWLGVSLGQRKNGFIEFELRSA
jgi:hypothetical protein